MVEVFLHLFFIELFDVQEHRVIDLFDHLCRLYWLIFDQ